MAQIVTVSSGRNPLHHLPVSSSSSSSNNNNNERGGSSGHTGTTTTHKTKLEEEEEEEAPSTNNTNNKLVDPNKKMKCCKMIALDLDGTLLHSDKTMSIETRHYLRELHAKTNIVILFATGRCAGSALKYVDELQLPGPFPIVSTNGAKGIIYDPNKEDDDDDENGTTLSTSCNVIFDTPLDLYSTHKVMEIAKKHNFVALYYYKDNQIYASQADEGAFMTKLFKKKLKSNVTHLDGNLRQELLAKQGLPTRILILYMESTTSQVVDIFKNQVGTNHVTIIPGMGGWYVELLNSKVTKGNGLQQMCQHYNISISDCIAFGDGENDIEFLQKAGLGVCMQNGSPEAKHAADVVVEWTNNQDGVLQYLQQLQANSTLFGGE